MNGRISMRSAVSTLLEQFPLQRQTYSALRTSRHPGAAYRKLPFVGVFPVRVDENTTFQLQSYGSAREADIEIVVDFKAFGIHLGPSCSRFVGVLKDSWRWLKQPCTEDPPKLGPLLQIDKSQKFGPPTDQPRDR